MGLLLPGHVVSAKLLAFTILLIAMMTDISTASGIAATNADASSRDDNLSLWEKKWEANQTGWHKADINHVLNKHGAKIIPAWKPLSIDESEADGEGACSRRGRSSKNDVDDSSASVRVFIPLCGKSLDMKYLAQASGIAEVVGIDGVNKALVSVVL